MKPRLVALYAVCSMEEPIYIIEELMDQCLNKYLQEQTTQDKTSLKDLTNMAAQVSPISYAQLLDSLVSCVNLVFLGVVCLDSVG